MVLKSRRLAPDWSANEDRLREAKCRKHPLPMDHNVHEDPWFHDMEAAAQICNGTNDGKVCPLRAACLDMALINNEQAGVFGGLLPIQRRWIRRHQRLPKETWNLSELWRQIVPPLEYFEELERRGITEHTYWPEA